MRLTQRLLIGSLAVVGLLVVLIVGLSSHRLRTRLVRETTAQLVREARLLSAEWGEREAADTLADAAGAALARRVTLIDTSGYVLGDSEFDRPALVRLENHLGHPEIVGARRDGLGIARRVSPSDGVEQLYVAVRSPHGYTRVSVGTEQLAAIVGQAQRDVLASAMAALALALALAWIFSRGVSRPVVELRDVARDLAAGNLSRRPSLSAPGEVGDLALALHSMAEQLASRLNALQAEDQLMSALLESLNEGVVAIDARRQVIRVNESGRRLLDLREPVPFSVDRLPRDRQLREALGGALVGDAVDPTEVVFGGRTFALTARPLADGGAVLALYDLTAVRRLESVRRDFVANVSHELKTPLTVIGGFAETLSDDDVTSEQRRQFAETIRASARRMQRIVDDLLDLSRIESGGWLPAPEPIDLTVATSDALLPCEPAAARRGLTLVRAIEPRARRVYADPTALRQVLDNLIENALRYTKTGGRITVFAEPDERGVWVGVRDTGIGIAPEHLGRIFERFYRVDPARSREAGGTGLGLSIVRHLVEAHGGRVRAESVPGRGTTVAAFFPQQPETVG